MPDYRYTTPSYAFYVESQNAQTETSKSASWLSKIVVQLMSMLSLVDEANDVPAKLHTFLQSANENYLKDSNAGKIGVPTIHVLKPGTFSEYREWKIKTMNISSGQVKVPLVVWDDVTRKWLEEHHDTPPAYLEKPQNLAMNCNLRNLNHTPHLSLTRQ